MAHKSEFVNVYEWHRTNREAVSESVGSVASGTNATKPTISLPPPTRVFESTHREVRNIVPYVPSDADSRKHGSVYVNHVFADGLRN